MAMKGLVLKARINRSLIVRLRSAAVSNERRPWSDWALNRLRKHIGDPARCVHVRTVRKYEVPKGELFAR